MNSDVAHIAWPRGRKGLIFSAADIFVRRWTSTFNLHVQRAGTKGHGYGSERSMRCVLLWDVLQLADAGTRLLCCVEHRRCSRSSAQRGSELRLRTGGCTEIKSTMFARNSANYAFAVIMFKQHARWQICVAQVWRVMRVWMYFAAVLMLLATAKW